MVEDALAETVHEGQPVRSRQIDPRLPLLGAAVPKRLRRNPELHGVLLFSRFLMKALYHCRLRSSLPGLPRQSIAERPFCEAGWMRGSSPRMTSRADAEANP